VPLLAFSFSILHCLFYNLHFYRVAATEQSEVDGEHCLAQNIVILSGHATPKLRGGESEESR